MADQADTEVRTIVGVGPHPVRSDVYQVELEMTAAPDAPSKYVTLLFRAEEAALLLKLLQARPPDDATHHRLQDAIAGHDT